MTPLIDGDILLHELGWSGEFKDKDTGESVLLDFKLVAEMLDKKIELICQDVGATTPPIIYITDSEKLTALINREGRWLGKPLRVYTPNFRYAVAKTQPYKGNRNNPKPFHFYNIIAYLRFNYDVRISENGYEADDMIVMEQMRRDDTIICSRDKDLRIAPGLHFSWECGKQPSIGPHFTDRIGELSLVRKLDAKGKVESTELKGYGLKFFYSQMLTGDTADHIPGLSRVGAVAAYNLLNELSSEEEIYEAVKAAYIDKMGDEAKDYFLEQANLLWMIQEVGQHYKPFKKEKHG
jgi:hypothetical protein